MGNRIAVPIDVSAFVLNENSARKSKDGEPPLAKIAPITQPNYVGMRLDEALMRHDLVDHIDFHMTQPAASNSRLTNFGDPVETRKNRIGVYLHWTLPRCYRSGRTTDSKAQTQPASDAERDDGTNPVFPIVPTRWLIVRRLTRQVGADQQLPEFQTWIIESNRVRNVKDVPPVLPDDVDIEVDVSPFVVEDPNADLETILQRQAEVLLGNKVEYSGWQNNVGWQERQTDNSVDANYTDLTVMGASNPLFPDYVPHNGGVFSLVDSFRYSAADGSIRNLIEADADYFVFGWHALGKDDPLVNKGNLSLNDALDQLKMYVDLDQAQVPESTKKDMRDVLAKSDPARLVLHGAMYGVKFRANEIIKSKADEAAAKFSDKIPMEPLSIGTTPLDAVMTFLEAHKGKDDALEQVLGDGAGSVSRLILAVSELLYAADDSYNSRVKAQDLYLYSSMFSKTVSSGYYWSYKERSKPGEPTKVMSDDLNRKLLQINDKQAALDVIERKLIHRRWELFAEWWKYVSDKSIIEQRNVVQEYATRVRTLKDEIRNSNNNSGLEQLVTRLRNEITQLVADKPFQKVPQDPFHVRNDPTLCIAGIEPGWPSDFMDTAKVRLIAQIPDADGNIVQKVFGNVAAPFSNDIGELGKKLLSECVARRADDVSRRQAKWSQHWGDTNPFQPLFLEWEAVYYHVDRTKWEVGVRPSPVGHPHSVVRYGVNELLASNSDNQKDYRIISGRTLILPQPVFSLESSVLAVLDSDLSGTLDKDELAKVKANIRRLKFVSCPLSGIKEHLTTRSMGTHVKPTITRRGKSTIPLPTAGRIAVGIGFDTGLELVDTETDLTPYGNLMSFPTSAYPKIPFKGIAHGQMLLTKLNIIDKFGQAITVPEPRAQLRDPPKPPPAAIPCMSDWVSPDVFQGRLNTIYPEPKAPTPGEWPQTRFIQIPPTINQGARINATFLSRVPGNKYPYWQETALEKSESPVFGWLVINYQDSGLQFFRPDGRFYREVRIGGVKGTNAGTKWLPFRPPTGQSGNTGDAQLDGLIGELTAAQTGKTFLSSFFHMINAAIKTMPFPPSDYSSYMNSLVGKPLALVNIGWSLELASPAIKAQNTLGNKPTNEQAELSSYRFPFKIGDADRPFDGVIGYFNTNNIGNGTTDWKNLYTYFTDPDNKPSKTDDDKPSTDPSKNVAIRAIKPSNFPRLNPTYIDPVTYSSSDPALVSRSFTSYTEARTAGYTIATLLIDPYTPIHAYSPILPIKSLEIPPWSIQQAFRRMTAFFRVGPTLLSRDVPYVYDSQRPLEPDSWATKRDPTDPNAPATKIDPSDPDAEAKRALLRDQQAAIPAIRLPISGKKGLWRWLQPYDVQPSDTGEANPPVNAVNVTRYNELDVTEEDTRIRKDPAPYTFVEGYLQLAAPLLIDQTTAGVSR